MLRALTLAAALAAAPAWAQPFEREAAAAAELRTMCTADAGVLWGVALCGPLIIVDPSTRSAWATQPDLEGALRPSGRGWAGVLPASAPIANTSTRWAGVDWIMILAPLPDDDAQRRVLLAHEAWHRAQTSLGLPPLNSENAHLETELGRYLLRLEQRALATALLSRGRARRTAAADALAFRLARHNQFASAASQEAALDRNEGLAAYTGVKLGAGADADFFAARTLNEHDGQDSVVRSYAYATGPAYGLLLDETEPGWRRSLGAYAPADLLVAPLRVQALSARSLARRAARYGGPQVAAEERARAQVQQQRLADLRVRFQGARLELPLTQANIEFDPNQVTPLDGLGNFYSVLTLRDVWGELRATEGALISSDFSRAWVLTPQGSGLSGPGWSVSLVPGYRMGLPSPGGVVRPEPAPPEAR